MMIDLNALPLPQLAKSLLATADVDQLLDIALHEDLAEAGDITSASIIDPDVAATGRIVARQSGIVAGLAVAMRLLDRVNSAPMMKCLVEDGEACEPEQAVAVLEGSLMQMLAFERPILNILGRLSGIATLTRQYVQSVAGKSTVICDTRKTIPGNRALEKYAVRCGGGTLHRIGLNDAALYKDNHLAHIPLAQLASALAVAAQRVRSEHDVRFVEVEVDSLEQLEQVLQIKPGLIDVVLLDNMSPRKMTKAVKMREAAGSSVLFEASGGVNLDSINAIASSGVERIAVGALTHSAIWLDFGLDMEPSLV